MADNDENCRRTQKRQNCSQKEDSCITVSYRYKIEDDDFSLHETFFEKQCHNSVAESCNQRRRGFEEIGIRNSQVC